MDLLHNVEGLDPRKAGNLIEKYLNSREFTDRYSAIGVWDVVMSSGVKAYVDVFDYLGPDVAMAARKGIPRDDEWYGNAEVEGWLSKYKTGKPTGKLRSRRFQPQALKGALWYIDGASASGTDLIEVEVELRNKYTNETKTLSETTDTPQSGYVESLDVEEHGGEHSTQQTIIVNAYDEEGQQWQLQWDVDTKTGEWSPRNERESWEGPH